MKRIDPVALFRLSVLGPLVSRDHLQRGELQRILRELAQREYAIPGTRRTRLGAKTIEGWYYTWKREGIEGLIPKSRDDKDQSKLSPMIQEAILAAKRENPRRSIRQIIRLMESCGSVAHKTLATSTVHRLLQYHGLSRTPACQPEEKRSFVAQRAGMIWYGDVMHGPKVSVKKRLQKTYLVSLMDDASRLINHAAFCPSETALDIEGLLKQAVLKRGVPQKLIIDNGPAYRAQTLQDICARLGIHLIYCRPYAPEGKGKLERWHRTVRDQFLSELDEGQIQDISDLNARLWSWIETLYHQSPHSGLENQTPLERYQKDLPHIRALGPLAARLDELFYHRVKRYVRKDGTVSYEAKKFEVPYELSGKTVQLVVDPHSERVVGIEDDEGRSLGSATPLDAIANLHRTRRKPKTEDGILHTSSGPNLLEIAHQKYYGLEEK